GHVGRSRGRDHNYVRTVDGLGQVGRRELHEAEALHGARDGDAAGPAHRVDFALVPAVQAHAVAFQAQVARHGHAAVAGADDAHGQFRTQKGHTHASLVTDTPRVATKKPQGKLWRSPKARGNTFTLPDDACEVS